jgi:tetratricopeptide (TPR) repeat protein
MWKPGVIREFISHAELSVFVMFILFLAAILFPKGRIEEYIKVEDVNVELSNFYLDNLYRKYKDPRIVDLLVDRYKLLGDEEQLKNLVEDLEKHHDRRLRAKALVLNYRTLKTKFFSEGLTQEDKKALRSNMEEYLIKAIFFSEDPKDIRYLYKEALSMEFHRVALISAKRLAEKDMADIRLLSEVYRLSIGMKDYASARYFLEKIIEKDNKNKVQWFYELYNLGIATKDYKLAEKSLMELMRLEPQNRELHRRELVNLYLYLGDRRTAIRLIEEYLKTEPTNRKWKEELTRLYLADGNYSTAHKLYKEMFIEETNPYERREYFKKAVQMLLWSGNYEELEVFLLENYKEFVRDRDMAEFILKAALATGKPSLYQPIAVEVSRSILK